MNLERTGLETKYSPHKTYIRRCELNLQTSEGIADLFSRVIQAPLLKEPLAQFLNNINDIPPSGLVGVGIAFWGQESLAAIASYFIIDADLTPPQASELTRETGSIHDDFATRIRSRKINVSTGAWYSHANEVSFSEVMEGTLEELYEPPEDPNATGAPDFFIVAKNQSLQSRSL